jgi:hypothetical protein
MMRRRLANLGLAVALGSSIATPLVASGTDRLSGALVCVWFAGIGVLGALVVRQVPGNAVGPLLTTIGAMGTLGIFAGEYTSFVFEEGHQNWPLGELAAWLSLWLTVPAFGLFTLVFLRFPDGALLSRRWRVVEVAALVSVTVGAVAVAFRPGPLSNHPSVDNPLGISGFDDVAAFTEGAGGGILTGVALITIVSLVIRFRRAGGIERRQIKSLALAAAALPLVFALSMLVGAVDPTEEDVFQFVTIMLGLFLIPIGLGVAILKYRLYDIDVIINRTLVYGALTALLVAAYLGLVVALQFVLDRFTQESDLAVAASTLAVAALFRPLRSKVQAFIDRRFYRRKYDSIRILASLSRRLRDEVDLSVVGEDVLGVVKETVQPAHASLWLRPEVTS